MVKVKVSTDAKLTITCWLSTIYMDKPVGSRFAHCGTQNSGLVAQELGLPFEQISSIYRKTSANAWNWYQRWL